MSSSSQRVNQINPSVLRESRPYKVMPKQGLLLSELSIVTQIMYICIVHQVSSDNEDHGGKIQWKELFLYLETIWPDDAYLYDRDMGIPVGSDLVDIYPKGSFLGRVCQFNVYYASKIHFIGWLSFESKLQGYQRSCAIVRSCKFLWETDCFIALHRIKV